MGHLPCTIAAMQTNQSRIFVIRDLNNGKTKGKKFYFSMYGKDTAWFLARKYREDMVKLIEQERIRLNELLEDSCGISKG